MMIEDLTLNYLELKFQCIRKMVFNILQSFKFIFNGKIVFVYVIFVYMQIGGLADRSDQLLFRMA